MSELASVHLRQARQFMQTGNWPRALELLEKARVLSRDSRELLIPVLKDLIQTYDALGQLDMSAQCRDRLNRLSPPKTDLTQASYPRRMAHSSFDFSPEVKLALIAAGVLVVVCLGVMVYLSLRPGSSVAVAQKPTGWVMAPAGTAMISPRPGAMPGPAILARPAPATPASLVSAPTTGTESPVAALPVPAASQVRETLLKDTVGMCLVVARFEGYVAGKQSRIDVPIAFGTAFVIHKSGLMLTNNHVVATAEQAKVPSSLRKWGLTGMLFRGLTYTVCFGSQPAERFVAKVMHRSEEYDMALLKIERKCLRALKFSHGRHAQGSEIYICGFPGTVVMSLNADVMTPEKIAERRQKWTEMHQVDAFEYFSEESFNSTLTRGIVSAADRRIHNASYVQVDAASMPGSSGGPVLDPNNEVVGILTMKPAEAEGANYSFALTLDQLDNELSPYLRE